MTPSVLMQCAPLRRQQRVFRALVSGEDTAPYFDGVPLLLPRPKEEVETFVEHMSRHFELLVSTNALEHVARAYVDHHFPRVQFCTGVVQCDVAVVHECVPVESDLVIRMAGSRCQTFDGQARTRTHVSQLLGGAAA